MISDEHLMQCLMSYGRATVQDFVTRSQDIQDAIDYIRTERHVEVLKITSFVTKDLVSFEKITDSD